MEPIIYFLIYIGLLKILFLVLSLYYVVCDVICVSFDVRIYVSVCEMYMQCVVLLCFVVCLTLLAFLLRSFCISQYHVYIIDVFLPFRVIHSVLLCG